MATIFESPTILWALLLALAILVSIQSVRVWVLRRRPGWRARRRNRVALRGENDALALLERAGYQVEAVQPRLIWRVWVDGRCHAIELRADLIVRRRGRRFVADVKTGHQAPRVQTAATRRQLLEYWLAYRTQGVLLVDMQAGRVHEVAFEVREAG